MAIIFISPKKQQRIIFWSATTVFMLALIGISAFMLLPEIKNQLTIIPETEAFKMPDVKINFSIVDSDKVKNLEPFANIDLQDIEVGSTNPFASYYQTILKTNTSKR